MEDQKILNQLYEDFNARNIDAVLAHLHTNVSWPNGWEGGDVNGHDEVRAYWLRQWQQIDPKVTPISFQFRESGEIAVNVRQTIKDLNGGLLSDGPVNHVYVFEEDKVRRMYIE